MELNEMGAERITAATLKALSQHLERKYKGNGEVLGHRSNARFLGECFRMSELSLMQSFRNATIIVNSKCINNVVEKLGTDSSSFEMTIESREYLRNVMTSLRVFANWVNNPPLAFFIESLKLTLTHPEFRWGSRLPFHESEGDLEVELYANKLAFLFRFALWDKVDLYLKEYGGYLHC